MKTDDLIRALGANSRRPAMTLAAALAVALLLAVIVATIVFAAAIGPRPDIEAAATTVRFLFKFVVTIALAATAFAALTALSRPQRPAARGMLWLAAAPLLLAAAVALELTVVPDADWGRRLVGSNNLACLALIPLIGIGPLALFIAALRHGAPAHPALAGAVAGLAAGGVAATLYAAHCTDDSPLFVATWYSLAIAALAVAGALAGRAFARW